MIGLNRLSIQSKMILLLLIVSLGSIGVMAVLGYTSAKAALTHSIEQHLNGVRVSKTTTLEAMLDSIRNQVISMSDSRAAIEGMRSFRDAYRELSAKSLTPSEEEQLKDFYRNDFIPKLGKSLEGQPILEQYISSSPTERYLQYHYIASNPNPYLKKHELVSSPTDKSSYGEAHARLHKFFSRAVTIFGFEDLMLVDADTLEVVYAYQKTTDFASNLATGPYAQTNLGARARALRTARDRDDFEIADFEDYRPTLGAPMGFAMSPIFDGSQMLGILVLQFPIETFNKVLTGNYKWMEEGMGRTGEVYLVGADKTMRSRSRFMYEDPQGFLSLLKTTGIGAKTLRQIERHGTVMNALPVSSGSADAALQGRSGIQRVTDYRGKRVLSAFGPIELDSLRWGVLAEMDEDEADAPIHQYGKKVIVVASAMALAVCLLALVCSHILTHPLRLLTEGAARLGAGDTDVQVPVTSRDEFGQLARVFNAMSESIKNQTTQLQEQVRENQELLLSILPASAVAQRQEGDERANRQFADVSVLFSEIQGMEDFGGRSGEEKALSALGDLVAAFDEAAEKFGIEKVKTIGTSYLAVCGLSVARPDHARRIVLFGEEIARIVSMFNREHKADLSVAVGINSGPVVGGVVGRRKFLYDLWGNTVTIAKNLAAAKGSAIRVTAAVKERLGDQFQFSGPLSVEVHGKPHTEVWQIAV